MPPFLPARRFRAICIPVNAGALAAALAAASSVPPRGNFLVLERDLGLQADPHPESPDPPFPPPSHARVPGGIFWYRCG